MISAEKELTLTQDTNTTMTNLSCSWSLIASTKHISSKVYRYSVNIRVFCFYFLIRLDQNQNSLHLFFFLKLELRLMFNYSYQNVTTKFFIYFHFMNRIIKLFFRKSLLVDLWSITYVLVPNKQKHRTTTHNQM